MAPAWGDSAVFPRGAVRDAVALNVNEHEVIELFRSTSSSHNHPGLKDTHTLTYDTAQEHMDTKNDQSMAT